MQYGQEEVEADFTFFSVENTDTNNPLNIIRTAITNHQAVPFYYSEGTGGAVFDGDMVVAATEVPIPSSDEVKVKVTLHPTNNYREWTWS